MKVINFQCFHVAVDQHVGLLLPVDTLKFLHNTSFAHMAVYI